MAIEKLIIRVTGRVQGVGFRYFTQQQANQIGVKGFVKNEYDGSVYIEAYGEKSLLTLFIEKIKWGPTLSRVDSGLEEWSNVDRCPYRDFSIK